MNNVPLKHVSKFRSNAATYCCFDSHLCSRGCKLVQGHVTFVVERK